MPRRALTVLSALAVASAAFVAGAPAASATTTCNTTSGGTFDDTTICYSTNGVIAGYVPVPYYVGPVCVAGFCTTPTSGTIDVPVPNANAVVLHGTLCVTVSKFKTCRNFTSAIPAIHIG